MQKDIQAEREAEKLKKISEANSIQEAEEEQQPVHKYPTWLLFIYVTMGLGAISIILLLFGAKVAAGAVFGCGMLILIVYSAFREVPPLRKNPGDGGNIDFGMRR